MRSKVVRTLALAMLLCGVGVGLAQQPQKKARVEEEEQAAPRAKEKAPQAKSKLEEMLAEALKHNPDIRVAAAKVAEADAELNRTRLQVTQKVVTLYYAIDTQKKTVAHQEAKFKRLQNLAATGVVGPEDVAEASQPITLAKAKLAELESQMPALLGNMSRTLGVEISRPPTQMAFSNDGKRLFLNFDTDIVRILPHRAAGPMAERILKALQTSVKVDYKNTTFREIFKDLEKKAPGLSLRDFPQADNFDATLHFEEALPVSAILQALADDSGVRFVVRDYGIRVITLTKTPTPPGALSIEEFLRQKPAQK